MLIAEAFAGFKVNRINLEKVPLLTDNQPTTYDELDEFYLVLAPISDNNPFGYMFSPDVRPLWGYYFSVVVKTWNEREKSPLQLEYVPVSPKSKSKKDFGEIRITNANLSLIQQYASDIKCLVSETNEKTIQSIRDSDGISSKIDKINNESFGD